MSEDQILYEVTDKVAVITLNRPEKANAQTMELLDDLDAAWEKAATDDEVRVIVLRGNGKHFSSGHDLSSGTAPPEKITLDWIYKIEARKYLEYSLRWRNVPKPSIAAVQGKCIAGALLLVWPCDLIVAAENAQFSDPVVYLGIGGVEYHGHTWELGARKAKEILFTGREPAVARRGARRRPAAARRRDLARQREQLRAPAGGGRGRHARPHRRARRAAAA
jgi:enoyl-CoA hydratase